MEIEFVTTRRDAVGEGALWDAKSGALWWVDIPAGLIFRLDPESKECAHWDFGEPVGCIALRERYGLVVAARSGFWFFDPQTMEKTPIADPEADKPHNRFNDGTTDPKGRFWAGTMKEGAPPAPEGRFYRLDPDGAVTAWRGAIYTTNGLAFSPDGRWLYFSDSFPQVRTIWRCAYDLKTGEPGEPELFFDTSALAGRPDGGTVDADGCYWMAGVGGGQVYCITPDGALERTIDVPVQRPSKPMFGGRDLDILYLTSIGAGADADAPDGRLLALTGLGARGVAQTRFKG